MCMNVGTLNHYARAFNTDYRQIPHSYTFQTSHLQLITQAILKVKKVYHPDDNHSCQTVQDIIKQFLPTQQFCITHKQTFKIKDL